jgi:predicted RNA-binding protein YlqC (UPF0109 family)
MRETKAVQRLRAAIDGLPKGSHQSAEISLELAASVARIDGKAGRIAKALERIATALETPDSAKAETALVDTPEGQS